MTPNPAAPVICTVSPTPAQFREVLAAAHDTIAGCPCGGADPRGCHRCLLRHARDADFPVTSRSEALTMLSDLLDSWNVTALGRTDEISLVDQVESELESRFLHALLDWAQRSDSGCSITRETDRDGARMAQLRFHTRDGRVTRWRLRLQNTIRGTRPDAHLVRLDAEPAEVALFLDGYQYHAAPTIPGRGGNRLSDDADKRARLRAHGISVFQFTWDDVERWRDKPVSRPPVWPPYGGIAQEAARGVYRQRSHREGADLAAHVWVNPIDTLLAYLAEPDADLWRWRAEAALAGLLRSPSAGSLACDPTEVAKALTSGVRGNGLRPAHAAAPASGPVTVVRALDDADCPLVLVIDRRAADPVWSAFAVIDDRTDVITADEAGHRRRWAAWLYWGNLIQFLVSDDMRGDADQLAWTTLDSFDPTLLAVCAGGGLVPAHRQLPLDEESQTWLARDDHAEPAVAAPTTAGDPQWNRVLALVAGEESGLHTLVRALADRGVPLPQVGYELDDAGWQAELAWPSLRIAVLLGSFHRLASTQEVDDRDRAFADAGWRARPTHGWTADELAGTIMADGHAAGSHSGEGA